MNVIYTAIAGNYDSLQPLPSVKNCQFIAFIDEPEKHSNEGWKTRKLISFHSDPVRNAKQYKVMSHEHLPEAAYSLWIDGNISIKEGFDLEAMIGNFLADHDLALFRHRQKRCSYHESRTCRKCLFDDPSVIDKQMDRYRSENFPENYGLTENRIILRRHTPLVARLNTTWWKEICNGSRRDQLSFMYSAWKTGTAFTTIPGNVGDNPFFELNKHRRAHARFQPTP
jgi:hypothetical protein